MKKILDLASVLWLAQACLVLILVAERFGASIFKLYMLGFDWPKPIFLSLEMVVLFLVYSVIALAVGTRWRKVALSRPVGRPAVLKLAVIFNGGGLMLVALMLLAKLAVTTGAL